MGIFRNSDSKQVKNISKEKFTKFYNVKEQRVQIDFLDAAVGELDDKKILLDEDNVTQAAKQLLLGFANNETKYNPIPRHIIISRDLIENHSEPDENSTDFEITSVEPRYSLDEIYLPAETKKQIMTALTIEKHNDKLRNDWGLKSVLKDGRAVILNFFGSPGTGKSMTAEAIAHFLGQKLINVNYAQLESKYVGETPKNIKKCFKEAMEQKAVLVFDEADSFLGKRLTNVNQSADYGVNVTRSVMLMELERFTGIVIFTTNLLSNYDDAFKRRIFANIEFSLPDEPGREKIWDAHLPDRLPLENGINSKLLSKKYPNVSGADIKDIVLYASINCLERGSEIIRTEDFDQAYSYILARYHDGKNVHITSEIISEDQYNKEMAGAKA